MTGPWHLTIATNHSDHLRSATILTDSSASVKQDIYYYPYGEIKTNTGSDITDYKFTDQEYDAETGLYYYNARYYDPKLARFISADTIVPDPLNPQALNRYTYVLNNPLIYVDPSGNFFWIAVAVGALIGGTSAAVQGGDLGDILTGMAIGAVSGAVGYGAGLAASSFVSASSATVTSVVAGAAGGTAAGATGAALTGGNIGQGALIGMIAGGIGGAIGGINFGSPYLEGMVQIGSGALVGGAASELTGGKFSEGFGLGALSGAVAFATTRILEGKRFSSKITEREKELFKKIEELGVNVSELKEFLRNNPTVARELPGGAELFKEINKIFDFFGSEIDYIRTEGSCHVSQCVHRRFGNFHVRYEDNTAVTIHYDKVDAVFSPTLHYMRDYKRLF